MALKPFSFRKLAISFTNLLLKLIFRNPKTLYRNYVSNASSLSHYGFEKFQFLAQRSDLKDHVLIFNVENTLLRSSSLFPYFMLVAFEAGSLIRALILFLLYPFLCLMSDDSALKVMVMVCFFGLKKENFRAGSAVLPKFFLEDVAHESFKVFVRAKKKVAVSNLPQVMVENFLRDYLDMDHVFGRDLKFFHGYFLGLMEGKKEIVVENNAFALERHNVVGVDKFKTSLDFKWLSHCKEIYLVSEKEKRNWHMLPRHLYRKPLIFHDGRLAFRPTPLSALAFFMWFPMGCILAIIRIIIALSLPYNIAIPILAFTGIQLRLRIPKTFNSRSKSQGLLYVCNHRTLLDPLMISFGLKNPVSAVTYSLSRVSELLSPIKTVRLTRDRDQDAKLMKKMLGQGDLVVCPEGTTCREPYLLRFSPLFSEMCEDIQPVAMDCHVSMFYGTTAGGLKCLDPLFFLMNPCPRYNVCFLESVQGVTFGAENSEKSRFDVSNLVQDEIAKALGFSSTMKTRKDKYLILAGNEGRVDNSSKP